MGIETAALAAVAPEIIGGTAAAAEGLGAAAALGTAAEGAAAAGTVASVPIAAGSLQAANMVGALGGNSLEAFLAANQGFGTAGLLESAATPSGLAGILGQKIMSGEAAKFAAAGQDGQEQPAQRPAPSTGPGTPARPNQNPGLTQASGLMQSSQQFSNPADLGVLGFADGGQVPLAQLFSDNLFSRTRQKREDEAGLNGTQQQPQPQGGVTINIGNAGDAKQTGSVPRTEAQTPSMGDLATSILQLIKAGAGYADGGTVRTGASDVKAGGEIRGKESKTGKDNQIIAVAGGEGILPKDVMDVPGVAEIVRGLIQTYHTPIRS